MYWNDRTEVKLSVRQLLSAVVEIKPSDKKHHVNLTIEYDHSVDNHRYQGISLHTYKEEADNIKLQIETMIKTINDLHTSYMQLASDTVFVFSVKDLR